MAESLVSSSQLNNYLKTIDMNNAGNKKVLSSIQLLHPRYMEEVLYFLITGIIVIEDLHDKDINNISAKVIIDGATGSQDSLKAHLDYYRDLLKNNPKYKQFNTTKHGETSLMIAAMLKSSDRFQIEFLVDELGNLAGSFPSVSEVTTMYEDTFDAPENQALVARCLFEAELLRDTYGITNFVVFHDRLMQQIKQNKFLKSVNVSSVRNDISETTIVGWIVRGLFNYSRYSNIIENMNSSLLTMASTFKEDNNGLGLGKYGLDKMLAEPQNTYNSVFSTTTSAREDSWLLSLFSVIHVRRVLKGEIFDGVFYPMDEVEYELELYSVMNDYFKEVQNMCLLFIESMKLKVGVPTNE